MSDVQRKPPLSRSQAADLLAGALTAEEKTLVQALLAGAKVLIGTSAPAAELGAEGDVYIRPGATWTGYGPKTGAGWGAGVAFGGGGGGAEEPIGEAEEESLSSGQIIPLDHDEVALDAPLRVEVWATRGEILSQTAYLAPRAANYDCDGLLVESEMISHASTGWGTAVSKENALLSVTYQLSALQYISCYHAVEEGCFGKAAISVDGGVTWLYHDGVEWLPMDIDRTTGDWGTAGCLLQSGGTSGWLPSGGGPALAEEQWADLGVTSSTDLRVAWALYRTASESAYINQITAAIDLAAVRVPIQIPAPSMGAGMDLTRDPVSLTRSYLEWQPAWGADYSDFSVTVWRS